MKPQYYQILFAIEEISLRILPILMHIYVIVQSFIVNYQNIPQNELASVLLSE